MKGQSLEELRRGIDALDQEILDRLNRRMRLVEQIGRIKAEKGLDTFDPGREEAVCRRLVEASPGPLPAESVRAIYREILAASRKLQQPLKVAFLGPEWTYSHLAALSVFGHSAHYLPQSALVDVFDHLSKGLARVAVVPIENSLEGGIGQTMDLLYERPVRVVGECYLEVAHCLCSRASDPGSVRKLYAHPHALGQCRRWISEHLRHAEIYECASTAQAARQAASEASGAALCNVKAAENYGLSVLAERVEDHAGNTTRFIVLGFEENSPTGDDKTSILFAVADKPGALYRVLEVLTQHGLNMTRIESRPNRLHPWQYLFFADIGGYERDERVRAALEEAASRTTFFKILGSYPRANPRHPIRFDLERSRFGG
ncbi:chorismate mutase [Desulfacinum hydrothermale DSM 13146]|uniref:Bifunctional chorismate mutase/prephenate dehydratase n=1 Tax=Desulfacinum hydrothermale DSM 13146 TaxID=1121390 RepID=A0A1W1XG59_9BACT|nr:prephenate dehydratase [Desulfacinum hydrothermale]SMC22774.1 chorismate mutase [Desulfacinum hydrothermale DSM 13146]